MDFLDPRKKRIRSIELLVTYFLVSILILLGTVILIYQAYGFGIDKNGKVIQNGLVFVSSNPNPANIIISGTSKGSTNARIILQSGNYSLQLQKSGYRDWHRNFTVEGGSVSHFDYPFLFPSQLSTKNIATYQNAPGLGIQSPDRRWVLIQKPGSITDFEEFDLNNPTVAPVTVSFPSGLFTLTTPGPQSLELAQWSTDNRHVLLKHINGGATEFVLLDRQTPSSSVNVSKTTSFNTGKVELVNNEYNRYYNFNQSIGTLSTATLDAPTPQTLASHVLAYKSFGTNLILYASDQNVATGQVAIRLLDRSTTYNIRTVAAGSSYQLQLAQYSGNWFYVVGSAAENRAYIYQNPEQQLQNQPDQPLIPINILRVVNPSYVSFSNNTRYIVLEGGAQFGIYDAEVDKVFNYSLNIPIDQPQFHASWMDGSHLEVVSNNQAVVFDYDSANMQKLMPANPNYLLFFDRNYKFLYTLAPAVSPPNTPTTNLTSTSLLAK